MFFLKIFKKDSFDPFRENKDFIFLLCEALPRFFSSFPKAKLMKKGYWRQYTSPCLALMIQAMPAQILGLFEVSIHKRKIVHFIDRCLYFSQSLSTIGVVKLP